MEPLSLKKLGKRPELHRVGVGGGAGVGVGVDVDVDGPLDTTHLPRRGRRAHSHGAGHAHQKRVLPSRSRRGGPGVGSCSVDLMIIDTERRARDGKAAVPPSQPFFLTTHARAVPPPPAAAAPDGEAAGSYFDKPEVKAAYLAQRAIQVPEFAPLPDDAVPGRLRTRAEEEGHETSDTAYINRHRKYETFEKRQRRREKEKLVHEQYKLKERIEQLKGMDASAFGAGGEARRREMLDVAEGLELRYAVLLPPDPKRMKKTVGKRRSEGPRAGTTTGDDADVDSEDGSAAPHGRDMLRTASTGPRPQQQLDRPGRATSRLALHPHTVSKSLAVSVALPTESTYTRASYVSPTVSAATSSRTGLHMRDGTGRLLMRADSEGAHPSRPIESTATPETSAHAPDAASAPPPRKRQRLDPQARRHPSPEASSPATSSVLLQIAARKAAQPSARQTARSTLAFGYRVPIEVEDLEEYALPAWLITRGELEHIHEMRARSATRSASPRVPNGVRRYAAAVRATQQVHQQPNGTPTAPHAMHEASGSHRPALPTSSIREENGKEVEDDS